MTKPATTAQLRDAFRKMQTAVSYEWHVDAAQFQAQIVERNGGKPESPEAWVSTAKTLTARCKRCAGTGQFITMVLNGKPTGPGGICFRCDGKGHQDVRDAVRNLNHDIHFVPAI